MARGIVRLSKFVSRVLRHEPAAAGLTLDAQGWADVEALLAGARAAGVHLDGRLLHRVVAENDKARFELSADGRRIRARQGHSVAVDLGLEPAVPPERLYHGTAAHVVADILREGLRPGRRHHVHLSPDVETARRVGARHGAPVVLTVEAGRLHADGATFFHTANGVWLVEAVPPAYLTAADGG